MKTLKTIQTLAKIGKIFSKIGFILALVSACICAVGLVLLPLGGGEVFKIGGMTLHGLLDVGEGEAVGIAATALSGWLVVCIGEGVLAKFSQNYFDHELAAGTPFTLPGARELTRLGILTIALPLGSVVVSEIVQGILAGVLDVARDQVNVSFDPDTAVTRGIFFLVMALLCRYGAELMNSTNDHGGDTQAVTE